MTNPEIVERLQDPVFTRFAEAELPELVRNENEWGTVSYQFADGSEALNLFLLRSRVIDYGLPVRDESLHPELSPETSTIAKLDHQLATHMIPRSFLFESKVKFIDQEAIRASEGVVALSEDYHYFEAVVGLDDIVEDKVKAHKEFRTKSLLNDLNYYFANLGYKDVWFKVHPLIDDSTTLAAQLVGFTLHGERERTAIEPIVMGLDGTVGLLPEDVYVDPYLSARVKH
ncbi:MAG: hypothetical protein WAV04_03235 [Candidatus Microsaccharimonas sp.]